jgi:hypothetical protein
VTIIFETPEGFADPSWWWADVNNSLSRMRQERLSKIERVGRYADSKVAWKVATFRELVRYRLVSLCESAALSCNAKKLPGAFVLARALVETITVLLALKYALDELIDKQDVDSIDALITNFHFATREEEWFEDYPGTKAKNILTSLTRSTLSFCRASAPDTMICRNAIIQMPLAFISCSRRSTPTPEHRPFPVRRTFKATTPDSCLRWR